MIRLHRTPYRLFNGIDNLPKARQFDVDAVFAHTSPSADFTLELNEGSGWHRDWLYASLFDYGGTAIATIKYQIGLGDVNEWFDLLWKEATPDQRVQCLGTMMTELCKLGGDINEISLHRCKPVADRPAFSRYIEEVQNEGVAIWQKIKDLVSTTIANHA